uniref:DNA-directed RNA polymerase n=1 Tax=Strongyloides venezuelensis TaxID=75913 RepID=A0A0K0FTI6_STRVS
MKQNDVSQLEVFLDISKEPQEQDLPQLSDLHWKGVVAAFKHKEIFAHWELQDLQWDKIHLNLLDKISKENVFLRLDAINRMPVTGTFFERLQEIILVTEKLFAGEENKFLIINKFANILPAEIKEKSMAPQNNSIESWKEYAKILDNNMKITLKNIDHSFSKPIRTSTPLSCRSTGQHSTEVSTGIDTLDASEISQISTKASTGIEIISSSNFTTPNYSNGTVITSANLQDESSKKRFSTGAHSNSTNLTTNSNDGSVIKLYSVKPIGNFKIIDAGCSQDIVEKILSPKNYELTVAFQIFKKLEHYGYSYIIKHNTGMNGNTRISKAGGQVNVFQQGVESFFALVTKSKSKSLLIITNQLDVFNEFKKFNTDFDNLFQTGYTSCKKAMVGVQDVQVSVMFIDKGIHIPLMTKVGGEIEKALKENVGNKDIPVTYKTNV